MLALATALSALTVVMSPAHAGPVDAPAPLVARAEAVEAIAIPVADMERALAFYTQVLPFERLADREVAGDAYERLYGVFGARVRAVRLGLGNERIELVQFLAPRGRALPEDSRANDRWFQHAAIVVADLDRAYAHLRAHGVEHASSGPQVLPAWNANAGGIGAFYFRDSEGNFLEIIHFPAGKGDPRWQRPTDRLFLGIDHTAIVVADTDRSLRWYRDGLGLRVAGESENYGPEQEHLNNVYGARLRITALRARSGPGVELLEYLAPRTGRAPPSDTVASDRWQWQVWFRTASDLVYAWRATPSAGGAPASSAPVALDGALGAGRATLLRDPDGHALVLAGGTLR
jgi:catechol 2,3-dioxygenase-like lactoylglutathione lyase family enzyme